MSGPWIIAAPLNVATQSPDDQGIIATPLSTATRWLDDSGIALLAKSQGKAQVIGTISIAPTWTLTTSGQASVSGTLGVHRYSTGMSAGQATVTGIIGSLFIWEGGQSDGTSTVTGTFIVGQLELVTASSAGSSSVTAYMTVDVPWRPAGEQTTDHDPTHPSRSARTDGNARRFFTPRSSGLVNGTPGVGS